MSYGIKVRWPDGGETWMTAMSEYVAPGHFKAASFGNKAEAEQAAQQMNLPAYRVVEITDDVD